MGHHDAQAKSAGMRSVPWHHVFKLSSPYPVLVLLHFMSLFFPLLLILLLLLDLLFLPTLLHVCQVHHALLLLLFALFLLPTLLHVSKVHFALLLLFLTLLVLTVAIASSCSTAFFSFFSFLPFFLGLRVPTRPPEVSVPLAWPSRFSPSEWTSS